MSESNGVNETAVIAGALFGSVCGIGLGFLRRLLYVYWMGAFSGVVYMLVESNVFDDTVETI
jgi:hypothetical protein